MKEHEAPVGSRILAWDKPPCLRTRYCRPIEVTVIAWSKAGLVKIRHDGQRGSGLWWNDHDTEAAEVIEILAAPKRRKGSK